MSTIHDESRIRGRWITNPSFEFGGAGLLLTDFSPSSMSMKHFSFPFTHGRCILVVQVAGDELPHGFEFLLA